jgi:hypothetical protein
VIRNATPSDTTAAREVLRASISEPCAADHRNDPAIAGRRLAVGAVGNDGENHLELCLSGSAIVRRQFCASRRPGRAGQQRGNTHCKLLSTETAHRFYLNRGYLGRGEPRHKFGASSSYPMSERI